MKLLELVANLATRWRHLHWLPILPPDAPLAYWFQIWPPDGANCISCKFAHQMAPLSLVPYLTTRWHHFHWLQTWPPDGTSKHFYTDTPQYPWHFATLSCSSQSNSTKITADTETEMLSLSLSLNNIELAASFCLEMEIMENSSLEDCRAPPPPTFLLLWIQIFSEKRAAKTNENTKKA